MKKILIAILILVVILVLKNIKTDAQENITQTHKIETFVLSENTFLKEEPPIREVQEAAIKYAEVELSKIKNWRRQAKLKAWLPKVTLSADTDVTDLWHWEGGSTTIVNDDFLRKGRRAIDWGVDFSWDFGELIWNEDQTSIDIRSRLMVKLRNEVLEAVNKLYFERLRTKIEIDNLPLEDMQRRRAKEIKLAELTSHLDALTGGYFSKNLGEKSENR